MKVLNLLTTILYDAIWSHRLCKTVSARSPVILSILSSTSTIRYGEFSSYSDQRRALVSSTSQTCHKQDGSQHFVGVYLDLYFQDDKSPFL